MSTVHDTVESADIMAAVDSEERARKAHDAAADSLRALVTAFRAANPPPAGKYWVLGLPWTADRGKMLLRDVPEACGHTYEDGTTCGDAAVAWDDAGGAWCDEHKEER